MAHFPHGAIAAAHAEQERKRREEEEEKMTTYNSDDLSNWEFKIVRSDSGAFRKPQVLQALIEEESVAGWEMLEKLDDRRVRFKRPTSAKRNDIHLPPGLDPYRSYYGSNKMKTKIILLLGILMLSLGLAVFYYLGVDSPGGDINWGSISVTIPVIGTLVALIAVAFIAKRRG